MINVQPVEQRQKHVHIEQGAHQMFSSSRNCRNHLPGDGLAWAIWQRDITDAAVEFLQAHFFGLRAAFV